MSGGNIGYLSQVLDGLGGTSLMPWHMLCRDICLKTDSSLLVADQHCSNNTRRCKKYQCRSPRIAWQDIAKLSMMIMMGALRFSFSTTV